jgi:metal-sulfur cluster biosynthetic enzyme
LKHVLDLAIGVNIVDLGPVYRIEVEGTGALASITLGGIRGESI